MIYNQFLFKDKLPLMNRGLDAYSTRQRTIAKNIANATSPHYRPEAVKFEEFFHNPEMVAKGVTDEDTHIPLGAKNPGDVEREIEDAAVPKAEVYFSGETHVNIDKEMSNMAQNQIKFRFASKMVGKYFQGMLTAITGYKQ